MDIFVVSYKVLLIKESYNHIKMYNDADDDDDEDDDKDVKPVWPSWDVDAMVKVTTYGAA
jgi:hypothetical protein